MTQNPSRNLPKVFVLINPKVIRILVVVCCPSLTLKARRSVKILKDVIFKQIIVQSIYYKTQHFCTPVVHPLISLSYPTLYSLLPPIVMFE